MTHNPPDIIPEISRVVLMRDGTVQKDGPKAAVLTSEAIGDLFHVREEGGYYYAVGY